MKKHSIFSLILIAGLAGSGCTTDYNEREIIGRWFSVAWLRNNAETDLTAWFEFNEDMTYRAVIARTQEEGKWWVEGYKLYTQAYGAEPIVVKIDKLEGGNLEIEMNRGGQAERLIFTRAQSK